jgi:hypothetical protein
MKGVKLQKFTAIKERQEKSYDTEIQSSLATLAPWW